jgi:flagellar hook-length control protein FliK
VKLAEPAPTATLATDATAAPTGQAAAAGSREPLAIGLPPLRPLADAPAAIARPAMPAALTATGAAATLMRESASLARPAAASPPLAAPPAAPGRRPGAERAATAAGAEAASGARARSGAAVAPVAPIPLAAAAEAGLAAAPQPAAAAGASSTGGDDGAPAPEAPPGERAAMPERLLTPRGASGMAAGPGGEAAPLEAAAAMEPTPGEATLRIADLPERALRLAGELRADGSKQYRAELQLDPPGLGRLRIEIEMSVPESGEGERSLTRITVETAAAHEQLQAELPRLRALLGEQGLGEAQVELQWRQERGENASERQHRQSPAAGGERDEREAGSRPFAWQSVHDGLIDLRA